MKCRFEHDGDCCNSGATQYMCKCKKPCDTIIPLTNADRIRAMTDEELAKWMSGGAAMSVGVCGYCKNSKLASCEGIPCEGKTDAEIILEWLQQPSEGE